MFKSRKDREKSAHLASQPVQLLSVARAPPHKSERGGAALEATQEQNDRFLSRLPYKCYIEEVASVADWLEICPWVVSRVGGYLLWDAIGSLFFESVTSWGRTCMYRSTHVSIKSPSFESYMKRELNWNLSGNKLHHTACSLLVISKNSCSKFIARKVFV